MFMLYIAERRKYGILREGGKKQTGESNTINSHKMVYTCNSEVSGIFFMWLTKIASGNNWWPYIPGLDVKPEEWRWDLSPPSSPAHLSSPPSPSTEGIKWILIDTFPVHRFWIWCVLSRVSVPSLQERKGIGSRPPSCFHYVLKAPIWALSSLCSVLPMSTKGA